MRPALSRSRTATFSSRTSARLDRLTLLSLSRPLPRTRSNMQDLVAEYQQYQEAGIDDEEEYVEEEGGEVRPTRPLRLELARAPRPHALADSYLLSCSTSRSKLICPALVHRRRRLPLRSLLRLLSSPRLPRPSGRAPSPHTTSVVLSSRSPSAPSPAMSKGLVSLVVSVRVGSRKALPGGLGSRSLALSTELARIPKRVLWLLGGESLESALRSSSGGRASRASRGAGSSARRSDLSRLVQFTV